MAGEGKGRALFGRVGKLVFAAPVVALLNARVGPQRADGGRVRRVDRAGHCLQVEEADGFRVFLRAEHTYTSTRIHYTYLYNYNVTNSCRSVIVTECSLIVTDGDWFTDNEARARPPLMISEQQDGDGWAM